MPLPDHILVNGKIYKRDGEFQTAAVAKDHVRLLRMNGYRATIRKSSYGTNVVYRRNKGFEMIVPGFHKRLI